MRLVHTAPYTMGAFAVCGILSMLPQMLFRWATASPSVTQRARERGIQGGVSLSQCDVYVTIAIHGP